VMEVATDVAASSSTTTTTMPSPKTTYAPIYVAATRQHVGKVRTILLWVASILYSCLSLALSLCVCVCARICLCIFFFFFFWIVVFFRRPCHWHY
jgi:hypothetical protein